jgi:hypothetical protein
MAIGMEKEESEGRLLVRFGFFSAFSFFFEPPFFFGLAAVSPFLAAIVNQVLDCVYNVINPLGRWLWDKTIPPRLAALISHKIVMTMTISHDHTGFPVLGLSKDIKR